MTESNKEYDYPADGSDSVLPTPGSLKDTPREQLDHDLEMLRRIRAGEYLGEAAVTETETPVVEEQSGSEQPLVQKYSQGTYHGH